MHYLDFRIEKLSGQRQKEPFIKKHPAYPEGGSEKPDFSRTSFMDGPLYLHNNGEVHNQNKRCEERSTKLWCVDQITIVFVPVDEIRCYSSYDNSSETDRKHPEENDSAHTFEDKIRKFYSATWIPPTYNINVKNLSNNYNNNF